MRDMSAKALLTGWFLGNRASRGLIVFAVVAWSAMKGLIWCIRHPKRTVPPMLGLLLGLYWFGSLWVCLIMTAALYLPVIAWWAWRLLGKSEIDTWPELIHGLPRLWRLHRTWPTLEPSTTLTNIVVTPRGVRAKLTSTSNSAHLKKKELDYAAQLQADRVVITPTASWLADIEVDFGRQYWGNDAENKHILYGLVNDNNDIIYVGITGIHRGTEPAMLSAYTESQLARRAAENRLREHREEQPWADEIAETQILGVYDSRGAVREAELDLIRRLGPTLYNKEGNHV